MTPVPLPTAEPGSRRRRNQVLEAACLTGAGALLLWRLPMLNSARFGPDEIEHLHAAWSHSQGLLIYRDFFEVHTPWFYLLLAQPLRWLEVAADPQQAEAYLFLGRWLAWLLALAALVATWATARLWRGRAVAAVAVLLLSACVTFLHKTLEIRPDGLGLVLWLLALLAALAGYRAPPRGARGYLLLAASGAALGGAVMCTQKLLFGLPGIAAASLVFLLDPASPGSAARRLRACAAQLAGLAAAWGATAVYFAWRGGLGELLHSCFVLTAQWPVRFSPLRYGSRLAASNPELVALALVGTVWAVAGVRRPEMRRRGDALLLLSLLSLAAGLVVVPVPYPQYYLHLLPLLALFAAAAFFDLLKRAARLAERSGLRLWWGLALAAAALATALLLVRPRPVDKLIAALAAGRHVGLIVLFAALVTAGILLFRHPRGRDPATALLALSLALYPASLMRHVLESDNRQQLADMRYVLETTAASDTVLDGWPGLAPFRRPAFFHHLPHLEIRELLGTERRERYADELESGAVAPELVLLDKDVRAFSPRIARFVEQHYEPQPVAELWRRKRTLR